MTKQLSVSIGQYSNKGRKQINQDFHGVVIPEGSALPSKGIAIALADGISSSEVSQFASESAVKGFLHDYYCTSDAWSVKTSAQKVLYATNSWLYAQTRQSRFRYEKDKGYVCTFSALILKSTTAYIFHAGDTRIYQLHNNSLEQLTEDHRLWIDHHTSYLNRALGVNPQLEIDYRSLPLQEGDVFLLSTDGVHEYWDNSHIVQLVRDHSQHLDLAARLIVEHALEQGSEDNLSLQIVRVDQLPCHNADEVYQQLTQRPFPPELAPRLEFDGYTILREIYISSRSHVFLAEDNQSKEPLIIKTPSVEQRSDTNYLERFLMEEWVARRINSVHVLKSCDPSRKRNYLYIATEYIEGQTLAQWMIDNPKPDVETVRDIVEQAAKGIQAFHRLEMLHQDLRPNNIMIDRNGTVKIIDFGSTRVAGVMEINTPLQRHEILGVAQYTAPEYFLGEGGSTRSDQFSLAVICYQMLSGRLPYGTEVAKSRTKATQRKLRYQSVLSEDREIPAWIDATLRKATHLDPYKRYDELSEFVFDLRHPNRDFIKQAQAPLMERNPVAFWQGVSLALTIGILILLFHNHL
ncbi:MAG: bifunctional protein-serine/threonine kinase/phosphatase [Gammaproteobacteria bacterium]|nr:bifunctional protein-serine/threonine kinase/phosphatase [Gammaproteobacteria bacterium]MDH5800137.1 bifunctional protein-serine/threonine kinase/phosphatase [Gammaproteobacteria bacterium]